jgi:hypothetical protein
MIFQVVLFNILTLTIIGIIGYFPARHLAAKTNNTGKITILFFSFVLGYFIFESVVGIWFTKGYTMQVLNFLPFLLLFFLPGKSEMGGDKEEKAVYLLIPFAIIFFSSWYFLRSYSINLQTIDYYPFIDLVSYAGTAFGMQWSGAEVTFADAAVYYPEAGKVNLYHFTELWAAVGLSKLFSVTELWAMCFLIPVFLLVLVSTGLTSIASRWKLHIIFSLFLIGALIYSNSKLLIFKDIFFYNLLDLCGLKISLIIPVFLFLFKIRKNQPILLVFLLWLPQVNILLGVLLACIFGLYFLVNIRNLRSMIPLHVWIGYLFYGLCFIFLAMKGKGSQSGPAFLEFSGSTAIGTFFSYMREAIFNLGFNYWMAFLVLSTLLVNRKYGLLILPFIFSKGIAKGITYLIPSSLPLIAGVEIVLFFTILLGLNQRLKIFPAKLYWGFVVLTILCLAGGIGYSLTGFMDFEQIYTLFACSSFFILVFFLFEKVEGESGFLSLDAFEPYKWFLGSLILVLITWQTFRFQRVIPFDKEFYESIGLQLKKESGNQFSAYFSSRKYLPFPLHIKAGFPLLFNNSTAISTPVTMFEDSSWIGKDIEWHVKVFPFYAFCFSKPGFNPKNDLQTMKERFIKEKRIRYIWIDEGYPKEKLNFLNGQVKKKFVSKTDRLEFWILNEEK